jgi:CubicO group peptidase (beta-lactamase class C family)
MSRITGVVILLCSLLLCGAAPAAHEVTAKQIDDLFAALKSSNAPGAAVLVLKDGHAVFERGYGVQDLQTLHRIDAHTNFRLASVTKQFTAMATMLLVHDGKLSYETRLSDIFPDFPEPGKLISIRNLLNHTSGLPDYEDLMPKYDSRASGGQISQIQDAEVLELLKHQGTTKFAPGSQWDYSNSGYVMLGLIVAKASGKPFAEFLRERIFAPLKMDQTIAYQKDRNTVQNRAFGHSMVKGTWRQTDQSPTSATLGDGGVYSSLADLAKWDRALREHALVGAAEMQAALTPVSVPDGSPKEPDGSPAAYGFGWFLNPYKGHSRMWHYGETVGFWTAIQRFPDDKLTIIILCNRSDLNPTALALKIADLYLSPGPSNNPNRVQKGSRDHESKRIHQDGLPGRRRIRSRASHR